ncbi:hypothetical protein ABZ023_18295 [Streptomyces sp. NPDC006367]|uniref:hypothetical protein n=1 Tax=unclassified Streptomyces TaxID=2593676 RepID=UPI0033A7C7D1
MTTTAAGRHFPEGALEHIGDAREFTAFTRERLNEALQGHVSDGERRLLDGLKSALVDYEGVYEGAAMSHVPSDQTGEADGRRWTLENLVWARFSDHPDYRKEWRP